jgi:uncharacterized protein (TIGR03435 family)
MSFRHTLKRLTVLSMSFVLATLIAAAQTAVPAKAPTFEVASIRQNMNPNPHWHMFFTADGVNAMDVTLQYAIRFAYGVYQNWLWSGGPEWLNERRFDIQAKYDVSEYPKPTPQQRRAMLQQLLADRFKLVVHHETKEFPLYDLVVAKNGPKFSESKPEEVQHNRINGGPVCVHFRSQGSHGLGLRGCSVKDLAFTLTGYPQIGRTVVDKTGLTGLYTFELHWRPENRSASVPLASISSALTPSPSVLAASDMSLPSIFTALKEQLGLELKPTKGPLDTIVIDHAEMPSAN